MPRRAIESVFAGAALEPPAGGDAAPAVASAGRAVVYSAPAPDRGSRGDDGDGNEDAAACFTLAHDAVVLAVADGMGGGPAGRRASRTALRVLERALSAAEEPSQGLRGAILDAIEAANREIRGWGLGAATTLVVAEVRDESARVYHVGDSGALVTGQRGRVKLRTTPQSPVGYAIESGLLEADEGLHAEDLHVVSNVLGSADMRVDLGSPLALAPRDTLLLASDGVLDNLAEGEIVELVRRGPLEPAAAALAAACARRMREPAAGAPSKPDDASFALYRPTA